MSGVTMESGSSQASYKVAGNTNEWQQHYNSYCSNQSMAFQYQVGETLSLFPFVCGLCFEKFDNIAVYYNHLNDSHNEAQRYFHGSHCSREVTVSESGDGAASETRLFYCGKCSYVSPSLCQLHEHLVEREHALRYQLVTDSRTAYPCSVKEELVDDQDGFTETDAVRESRSSATQTSRKEQYQNPNADLSTVKSDSSISQADVKTMLRTTVNLEKHTVQTLNNISEKISKKRKSAQPPQNKKNKSSVMDDEIPESASQNVSTEHHEICVGDDIKHQLDSLDSEHQTETDYTPEMKHSNHIKAPVESNTCKPDSSSVIKSKVVFAESEKLPISSDCVSVEDSDCEPVKPWRPFIPCDRCGLTVNRKSLKNHMATHSDARNFPCEQCSSRFKTYRQLQRHKKSVHVEKNTAICQVCGKAFKNRQYLRHHKVIHSERDKKCPHCPATFNNINILRRHIKVHSGERPWSCTWPSCDKRFSRSDDLARHRRTHTGTSNSNIWPVSREKGPSDITNSVDQDHPTYDVQNAYT